ncbi:ABC transporter [Clostridiales bacterium S5-A14a]|nr:ABC transporter [Clostridiales bacterium S5-A14a]
MSTCIKLIKRNVKLFFKDKGMLFTSLITPIILLVLYATFLANVYEQSLTENLPNSIQLSKNVIDGFVASQLMSSLLAVSCVTVAFSSNFLMVQDKVNGTIKDFKTSPVKSSILSISYYIATLISTFIISILAMCACLGYVYIKGWYMSSSDVIMLFIDVVLLILFGTALSSVINFFLTTQGQITAVGTMVGAGYGFICGAYMPISSFSEGLQKVIMFLPGTYATSLIRNHSLRGVLDEFNSQGIPKMILTSMKDVFDCNLYFFDKKVEMTTMYLILCITIILLLAIYILLNKFKKAN